MKSKTNGEFIFENDQEPPQKSTLYEKHLQLTQKSQMADFAGYIMPLWYSSIKSEHDAVRQNAGIFDCSHMSTIQISGPTAAQFLDIFTTNKISTMNLQQARYSYILDAAGNILDDIIVYRRTQDNFMVVVNAGNEKKIHAYLEALMNDKIIIDTQTPEKKLHCKPIIKNMKDTSSCDDCRVDIAIQGPASQDIINSLIDQDAKQQLENLKPFYFIETKLANFDCIIAKTGYTGAKTGFEIFVSPENAPKLWDILLQNNSAPCGLGSRDSLRIQAGLPLYGHELAGNFNISPFAAGYGWAVKLEKDFFIGKAAIQQASENFPMKVVRIELQGQKGIRPARPHDVIINNDGICIGEILSCVKIEDKQIALAYVDKNTNESDNVGMYYLARNARQIQQGKKETVSIGEKCDIEITGKVISRFEKF